MEKILVNESFIGRRFFVNIDNAIKEVEITNFLVSRHLSDRSSSDGNIYAKTFVICNVATEDGVKEDKFTFKHFYITIDDAIKESSDYYELESCACNKLLSSRGFPETWKAIEVFYVSDEGSVQKGKITDYSFYLIKEGRKEDCILREIDMNDPKYILDKKWYTSKEYANVEANKRKKIFRLP